MNIYNKRLYKHSYEMLRKDIEYMISATPIGELRDKLTDINILLLEIEDKIKEIVKI